MRPDPAVLLNLCPHTAMYVSAYIYAIYLASRYCYVCLLMLLYMFPQVRCRGIHDKRSLATVRLLLNWGARADIGDRCNGTALKFAHVLLEWRPLIEKRTL